MLTQSPQHDRAHPAVIPGTETGGGGGLANGLLTQLQRLVCGLKGHTKLLQFEQGRMYLLCVSCGHETPGWEIGRSRRSLRLASERKSRRTSRPDFAPAQRVA